MPQSIQGSRGVSPLKPTVEQHNPNTPIRLKTATHLNASLSPLDYRRMSPRAEDMSKRPKKAAGTRKRLIQYQTFSDAVSLLAKSKRIVVLTGAGTSTSVGIPDFRSDKGLYNQLSNDLGITMAEDFFSRQYFVHNPEQFFEYVKRVVPRSIPLPDGHYRIVDMQNGAQAQSAFVPKFTPTHAFLAFLNSRGKLLTNYTQNIDGLEAAAGLPPQKYIQCHGSWDTATCLTCGKSSPAKRYLPVIFGGGVPFCKCSLDSPPPKRKKANAGTKRKRRREEEDWGSDHSSDDNTQPPRGLLKPNITFFEDRISGAYDHRLDSDKSEIDLLIIVGTSLKVAPVQNMLYEINPTVPQIWISKERFSGALCSLPGVQVDIELLGECDTIVQELCRQAGWQGELDKWLWEEGQTTVKGFTSQPLFQHTMANNTGGESRAEEHKKSDRDEQAHKRLKTSSTSVDPSSELQATSSEVPLAPAPTASANFPTNPAPNPLSPSLAPSTPTSAPAAATNDSTNLNTPPQNFPTDSSDTKSATSTVLMTRDNIYPTHHPDHQPKHEAKTSERSTSVSPSSADKQSRSHSRSRSTNEEQRKNLLHAAKENTESPTTSNTKPDNNNDTSGEISHVKIELVEGTSHQWTVKRRK